MADTKGSKKEKLVVGLLGSTGRVGGWVLEELLERSRNDHDDSSSDILTIKVLVRSPSKLQSYSQNDKVTIVEGSATDSAVLTDFLRGVDVLVSTIGSPSNEMLVVEDTAKALVEALQLQKQQQQQQQGKLPRIVWMTTTGVNEATAQAESYPLFGTKASNWFFGYGLFGFLVMKFLIPVVIGQKLWDDMAKSETVLRSCGDETITKRTVIVRPTNMHPVSEHAAFSEAWRKEGGENVKYVLVPADAPPPGKWINRRAIAAALCDLAVHDETRDGTAVSLFQEGAP